MTQQTYEDDRNPEGEALDSGLAMPEHISQRLNSNRRQIVQDFERKQRSGRRTNWGATPWLAGAGLVAATVSAVVIAPRLQVSEPQATAMPIELIAAEEELEFFQTMEYLEWSLNDEHTS